MAARFNIAAETPDLYDALLQLNAAMANSGVDERLVHLIKIRVSQINGCAFCVAMHVKEALAFGIPERTLHMLTVWREASVFDAKARAALEWAESVTLLTETRVPNAVFQAVREEFAETEVAELTVAIATMNLWNRIAVSARMTA